MTPLTALKFAELTLKAGIPKGVVNILPGSGKGRGRVTRCLWSEQGLLHDVPWWVPTVGLGAKEASLGGGDPHLEGFSFNT